MKTALSPSALLGALLLLAPLSAVSADANAARPLLHPLFSDHAVLQRGVEVPVWGWAAPGTRVTLTFAGQTRTAVAQPDGTWRARLRPMRASSTGATLEVTTETGETGRVQDLLVGDVWLCSGQSNMEMGMLACEAHDDIASANLPLIRLLTVPHQVEKQPVPLAPIQWAVCAPESLKQGVYGGFSAAAYYFGRKLHRELQIPIGLIHSSWGGTIAEAWTSFEALEKMASMRERLDAFAASRAQAENPADFAQVFERWAQQKDPGTAQGWSRADTDTTQWKRAAMPQHFENAGVPDFDGTVWLRREFEVPAEWAGKPATLSLGAIDDIDTTWINGKWVGQMNSYNERRVYKVGADVLRAGKNVLVIRVLDTAGSGGLSGPADQLFVRPADAQGSGLSLAGEWQLRDSAPLKDLGAPPQPPDPNNPNVTTVLYNGMIAPLLPFAIKGAIWYQGESNAGRAEQYRELLPTLIRDWRTRFGVGEFPFYIVQLASFMPTHPEPRENEWAELREAQALTADRVANCGLAVAIDIGEANDIHPKNKRDVGERLALAALAKTYGKKVEYSGPWYRKLKVEGSRIRLSFDHVGGGLTAKGDALKGFAIAGEDRKFVWADAAIDGQTVVVSAPSVPRPVAVRYGWDINPVCNLYNQAGLPAVPFRTDDWPGVTAGRK